jgi:hypothetical protein
MRGSLVLVVLLAGCASSPEYVAEQSNFDVCRLTMGGPHARAAEHEAYNRGLNCAAMYPAIQARMQQENAATQQFIQTLTPQRRPVPAIAPSVTCHSRRVGDAVQTFCN